MNDPSGTNTEMIEEIYVLKQRIRELEQSEPERRKAEEGLRRSEARYRTLFEQVAVGVAEIENITGRFLTVNRRLCELVGRTEEELLATTYLAITHPDDLQLHEEKSALLLAGEIGHYTLEKRYISKDGTTIWVNITVSHPWKPGEKSGCNIVVVEDITERKRAEEALKEKTEELDGYFSTALDLFCIADTDGCFRHLNRQWEMTLGYSLVELEGRRFLDFVHPDDMESTLQAISRLDRQEQVLNFVNRYRCRDGSYRWIEWRSSPRGKLIYAAARDITERKQAEDAFREQGIKMSSIFRAAPVGIGMVIKRVLWEANDMLCSMTGYSREELLGRDARMLYPTQEDYEYVGQEKYRQIGEKSIGTVETRWKKKDGTVIHIILSSTPLDPNDLARGVTFTALDITERKRAEEELRESEEKHRILLEESSDPIFSFSPEGQYKYVNQAFAKGTGKPVEEIIGKRIWDVFPKEEADKRFASLSQVFHTGEEKAVEVRVPRADGDRYYVTTITPIKDTGGEVVSAICSSKDITERKRAEEELRESEERFRALSENAPDIIYTVNLEGTITYVNPSWKRVLGHGEEDLLGRYFTDFAREGDRRVYRKLLKGVRDDRNNVHNHIGVLLAKDGTERVFNMNSAFNRDSKGHIVGVVGTMKDITELREMEKKLNHAQKMEAMGTLAGGIAHDFNNLLMGIQGYASLTLLDLDPSHPHYERLKRIEEQVQSGADLTRQLLGFARGGRYEVKPADINDILEKSSSMFGRTKKEISIYRKYGKDLRSVEVDRGQMEQVFMNLFVNAWQAMPGGGELYLETEDVLLGDEQAVSYSVRPGKYVKISVTDTGTGMDEKTRERIFDPFFTTKEMGRGTGLGLATVYGIIKGHGGAINVYSDPGHGTTFNIYLPASEREVIREKTEAGTIATGTETLLLVDDEKMVLEVSREMLESLGYRVYAVGSGQEALAVYMEKQQEIDLVILDMIMPGISGGETFDRLREINSALRVLLSSGYSINGQAQEILNRGCNGFLQKPFHLEKLSGKVREMLV